MCATVYVLEALALVDLFIYFLSDLKMTARLGPDLVNTHLA